MAGAAASWISPPAVVAIAGALGVVAAAVLATEWARHRGFLAGLAGGRRSAAAASAPSAGTPAASDPGGG